MQPTFLSLISGQPLRVQLLNSPTVNKFVTRHLDQDADWVKSITESSVDVALIQADQFNQHQYEGLLASGILSKCEIMFVGNGKPNLSIEKAMHRGASYHFKEPIDFQYLEEILDELYTDIDQKDQDPDGVVTSTLDQYGLLAGSSKTMRRLYRIVHKASRSKSSVFLVGESGTGKELVANTIHRGSDRKSNPFVAINCGALSPGLIESELFGHVKGAFTGAGKDRSGVFEAAKGGTLFLDEITEMPMDHQVKLLRVLETGEYRSLGSDELKIADVRIIAATNRVPSGAIQDKCLREDLYFRLCQFPICVPALRQREDDIIGLAKHFLAYRNSEENTATDLAGDALEKIKQYNWPGNVRELKHAIETAYILADNTITAEHLLIENVIYAPEQTCSLPTNMPLAELEKKVILKTLEINYGNKTETAIQLGISVKTLYNKLERYNQQNDLDSAQTGTEVLHSAILNSLHNLPITKLLS